MELENNNKFLLLIRSYVKQRNINRPYNVINLLIELCSVFVHAQVISIPNSLLF